VQSEDAKTVKDRGERRWREREKRIRRIQVISISIFVEKSGFLL
jgi:hypothetical protein